MVGEYGEARAYSSFKGGGRLFLPIVDSNDPTGDTYQTFGLFLGTSQCLYNCCWAVLTFVWEPSVPFFGAGSENCPGFFFPKNVFSFWESSRFSEFLKNPIRQFSGSMILTEFWTVGSQGRYSQVSSHKLWFFVIYIYITFFWFFCVSFLTISIFFCSKFCSNLKITGNKLKGGFFFLNFNFTKKVEKKSNV